MSVMKTGIIADYKNDHGFGFILESDGKRNFFHIQQCKGFSPEVGQRVSFAIGEGRKGPAAINIKWLDAPSSVADALAGVK